MTWCLTGRIEDFFLPQVVALLEAVQSTGRLEIEGPGGIGSLGISKGSIVSALFGSRNGEVAAYIILSWPNGEFRFSRDYAEQGGKLSHSNQALCLEAMRLLDDSQNPTLSFASSARPRQQDLDEPSRLVLLSLDRGAATVKEVASRCGMTAVEAYYYLDRLEREGAATRSADRRPLIVRDSRGSGIIRILVVDDWELMRRALTRLFDSDPGMKVVGAASNGEEALSLLPVTRPDVISLDLHMPGMDGVTTLKRIMLTYPTPTIIVTASNPDALDLTFESILRFGAIDFITKPSRSRGDPGQQERYVLQRFRKAAQINLRGVRLFQPRPNISPRRALPGRSSGLLVAVGGTGACLSYMQLLSDLPADLPLAVLGVLPFAGDFLRAFTEYMAKYSAFELRVACDGARLEGGVFYMASSSLPLRISDDGHGGILQSRALYGPCDPNVLLFDASQVFGDQAIALLLSSESQSMASGLAAIRDAGGMTMAQLPETCVDSEGPGEAVNHGLIDKIVVLNGISNDLSQFFIDRLHVVGRRTSATEGGKPWPRKSA